MEYLIKTTKVEVNGRNYSESPFDAILDYVQINIFPLKIEEEYVKLGNLLEDYVRACASLNMNATNTSRTAMQLNKNYQSQITQKESIDSEKGKLQEVVNLMQQLVSTMGDETTLEHFAKLTELSIKAQEVAKQRDLCDKKFKNTETKETDLRDKNVEYNGNAIEARNRISEIIPRLASQLKTVMDLNLDGKDRLDNLEATSRNLHFIDTMNTIGNDTTKEIMKKVLQSYLHMRVAGFKKLKGWAERLILAYNTHNTILTNSGLGDLEELSTILNMMANINIADPVEGVVAVPNYNGYNNNLASLMNAITVTLNGEDPSVIEETLMKLDFLNHFSYSHDEAYNELMKYMSIHDISFDKKK